MLVTPADAQLSPRIGAATAASPRWAVGRKSAESTTSTTSSGHSWELVQP